MSPRKKAVEEKVHKSSSEEALEQAIDSLNKTFEAGGAINITPDVDRITLPEGMSFEDAAEALTSAHEAREEVTERNIQVVGSSTPDLIYCAFQGIREVVGGVLDTSTFFGLIPGQSVTIATDYNDTINIPVGNLAAAGWSNHLMLNLSVISGMDDLVGHVIVEARYRRKFAPLVDRIEKSINRWVRERSIYKGKAVDSLLKFVDVRVDRSRIVYSAAELAQLNADIFAPIEFSELFRSKRLPLKATYLMHGDYGTGKTLTATLIASICKDNEWTFLYVRPEADFSKMLELAKHLEPCVVFVEDVDRVMGAEDEIGVGRILNTIDGALTKNSEVIVILSTNHHDTLDTAMRRPGRIDDLISLGKLDAETTVKLIRAYAPHINGDLDVDKVWEAAQGYTPAFVAEACRRAMRYAIANTQDENAQISGDDVINALYSLRPQYEWMQEAVQTKHLPTLDSVMRELVVGVITNGENELPDLSGVVNAIQRDGRTTRGDVGKVGALVKDAVNQHVTAEISKIRR